MQRLTKLLVIVAATVMASCMFKPQEATRSTAPSVTVGSQLAVQSLLMSMADNYIAALSEAVYLVTRNGTLDGKGRWMAQSFLRNGVGASLDIAVGPNPSTSILDLLVLVSLQTWSYEAHWLPAGIGEAGRPAVEKLKTAEREIWQEAGQKLSAGQLQTLRSLIDAWIAQNPNRTVVALVRFDEFSDARRMSSAALREKARGLLKEVSEASATVDDARLLGERLLWLAGRYLYLMGEQTELTAYRLFDQPESAELLKAIQSARQLSDTLNARIDSIQQDLQDQRAEFFSQVTEERTAAINQLQQALEAAVQVSLDQATEKINTERNAAIDQLFARFGDERKLLLDDFVARQKELSQLLAEVNTTITGSRNLATDLTKTVDALDRAMKHFDSDPNDDEPFRLSDLRQAMIETGRSAELLTTMLERSVQLVESKALERHIDRLSEPLERVIDHAFWRGLLLIGILLAGLVLLRRLPRQPEKSKTTDNNAGDQPDRRSTE